jgi:hypothetical protein
LLHRDGSIEDYYAKFMTLSRRDPAIFEEHQVQLFMAGLGHQLCSDIALQQLAMLDHTVMYAQA